MLLFGVIGRNGKYSRAWRLVSVETKPELYLVPVGLDRFVHASYHESGRWHLTLRLPGQQPQRQQIDGPELAKGVRHLFSIYVPPSAIYLDHAPDGVQWIEAPRDNQWLFFELLHETRPIDPEAWPGRRSGNGFIGRLPIAGDAASATVISHKQHVRRPFETVFSSAGREMRDEVSALGTERFRSFVIGEDVDGVTWVADGWFSTEWLERRP